MLDFILSSSKSLLFVFPDCNITYYILLDLYQIMRLKRITTLQRAYFSRFERTLHCNEIAIEFYKTTWYSGNSMSSEDSSESSESTEVPLFWVITACAGGGGGTVFVEAGHFIGCPWATGFEVML